MTTLAFLEPGHFHAALTLREAHPRLAAEVRVYSRPGPELDAFLALVHAFNTRVERPTAWRPVVVRGGQPLERLLDEGRADVVVLAGRNDTKMADIRRLHDAGLPVLGDKPWVTGPACLPHLEAVTAGPPLAMDLMINRHELWARLLKRLVAEPAVFGAFRTDEADGPAIVMESVHHLAKTVNGAPLVRPPWYFDVRVQGDGLVDVPTHLADLAMWLLGEAPWDHARDVRLESARRWATPVSAALYERTTQTAAFPETLAPWLRGGVLHLPCNGEVACRLREVPTRLRSEWHAEPPPGGGDTEQVVLRGTRADVTVEQGPLTDFVARIAVRPRTGAEGVAPALAQAVAAWQPALPGLAVVSAPDGRLVLEAPPALRTTHEGHFAQVRDAFLEALHTGTWPAAEAAHLRCKYTLLATASGAAADVDDADAAPSGTAVPRGAGADA